jgi:LemA protein
MGAVYVVLAIAGVVVLGVVIYVVGIYNQLVSLRVNIDKSWANIDVLQKQRYDEIPKLVTVCEAYLQYERDTLERITRARTSFLSATTPQGVAQADGQLAGALKTLFAVAENYPELKANQNFMQLQQRITALENQIADRREFYNDSVTVFNTRIQQIPDALIANLLGYRQREMYQVSAEERRSPDINFSMPK